MSNYFTFWHITAPVFIRPTESDALFQSANTLALSKSLLDFAETQQNFAVLVGPAGTGKTTLLRWLSQTLPMKSFDVFLTTLLGREHDSGWLLPRVAEFFQTGSRDKKNWKEVITNGLDQLTKENRRLIVCIDTAHLICTEEALSDLEAFFNLQDLSGIRISFVLSGNQELIERLKKHPSISIRVNSFFSTTNLTCDELESYVDHRLRKAGVPAAFDPEAILAIYNETNGNFLTSNTVLEKCLIEAANKSARRITTFIVEKALGAGFIKQKTAENPAVIEAVKDKEKLATTLLSSEGKKPEKFDRIPNAEHQKVSKNEHERSGSIKLSSLFKQEKD
jgi:type II secretory pathway predicted ATPase ExeA